MGWGYYSGETRRIEGKSRLPTSLLELINVSCQFEAVEAVKSVSFTVQQGEFVTLLGPSGCGKTTTLRLIAGFEVPDSGVIRFQGEVFADKNTFVQPQNRQIGMVFQDYALFPHLNVAQNIVFGLQADNREKAARLSELLELVGLRGFNDRMPYELSGGEQQRVALARALAPAPKMLLLDEPFSSLDAALRVQLRAEMRTILRQIGTTCIFVTHAQDEALSLSDRVAVMFGGRIAQVALPEEVYETPASLEVATFVGEANLLAGEAQGSYAETILGRIELLEPAAGSVTLLIRPEAVHLAPETGGEEGMRGRILWTEYYGHDRRVGVTTGDGTVIIARVGARGFLPKGGNVTISVDQKVKAYGSESSAYHL